MKLEIFALYTFQFFFLSKFYEIAQNKDEVQNSVEKDRG